MELKNQPAGMEELWIESASNGDLDAFNQLVLKHQECCVSSRPCDVER
ncbi:hypothetical protein [Candidatus Villigracilis affinis]|nr:hypothetical protein [Anaerolineales bacterium]